MEIENATCYSSFFGLGLGLVLVFSSGLGVRILS